MKLNRFFLFLIILVLSMVFVSCGGGVENSPAAQAATKAFSIGNDSWDTLQEAVNFLKGKSIGIKASSYTIRLNRNVTDPGAEVSGINSTVKIDFDSYTYTLKSGKGIIIDNTWPVEISGGKITVVDNGSLEADTVIKASTDVKLTNTVVDVSNAAVNAVETTGGTLSIEGTTSIKTQDDQRVIIALGESSVSVPETSTVTLTGGLKMEDKAYVDLGNAALNLTRDIERSGIETNLITENAVITTGESVDQDNLEDAIHNHVFSDKWSANETHHWHASVCEHSELKVSYGEHSWGTGTITAYPDCENDGIIEFVCECGRKKYEGIPALGHDLVHHEGKTATCTEDGWNAYDACSRCDFTTYSEIPATGHSFKEEWSMDSEKHWHDSLCGHDVVADEGIHEWGDDDHCIVCGYDRKGKGELLIIDPQEYALSIEFPESWNDSLIVSFPVEAVLRAILSPTNEDAEFNFFVDGEFIDTSDGILFLGVGPDKTNLSQGYHLITVRAHFDETSYTESYVIAVMAD